MSPELELSQEMSAGPARLRVDVLGGPARESIVNDMDLLQLARRDAAAMVEADPQLADPSRQRLRQVLLQQYGDALGLIDVG